jgi:hypothetical protein
MSKAATPLRNSISEFAMLLTVVAALSGSMSLHQAVGEDGQHGDDYVCEPGS